MSQTPCHCISLRKASRKLSALYDEALQPLGINIAQFSLLRNIARLEPISLTDLATGVELDRSTVGRNIKILQRMGSVRQVSGDDQRQVLLELTQDGRDTLAKGNPLWDRVQDDIDARLGPENLRQLHELLALF